MDKQAQLSTLNQIWISPHPLLVNNNPFEKKLVKISKQFDSQLKTNEDALAPAFYSPDLNIMFNLIHITDHPAPGAQSTARHIDHYTANIQQALRENLSAPDHPDLMQSLWAKQYPGISRKGLILYDETENYILGELLCVLDDGQGVFSWDEEKLKMYKPWMDQKILETVYASSCDFLIWIMPHKDTFLLEYADDPVFPDVVVFDTRFKQAGLGIDYDYTKISRVSM